MKSSCCWPCLTIAVQLFLFFYGSMAATTRVERLQYKEILTPKWRQVDDPPLPWNAASSAASSSSSAAAVPLVPSCATAKLAVP